MALCGRKGCHHQANNGRYFCSRDCARLDMDGPSLDTSSETVIEKSSFRAGGVPLEPFIPEGAEIEAESTPSNIENAKEITTSTTKNFSDKEPKPNARIGQRLSARQIPKSPPIEKEQTENTIEDYGMSGTEETTSITAPRNEQDETDETPPVDFSPSTIDLEKARFQSMSLLDDSAKHLLGYMKSIGNDCTENPGLKIPQTINAVAKIGKTIAEMAKVKLEAIKEARRPL